MSAFHLMLLLAYTIVFVFFEPSVWASKVLGKISQGKYNGTNDQQNYTNFRSYDVFTSNCKIPHVNSFSTELIAKFEAVKYKSCKTKYKFVSADFDDEKKHYFLHIHANLTKENLVCYYHEVVRHSVKSLADSHFKLLAPVNFVDGYAVPRGFQFIIVKCSIRQNTTIVVYVDAFAFVQLQQQKNYETKRQQANGKAARKPSVFMIGIDGMSRMNFKRVMPFTKKLLHQNGWYPLKGYNKVDDNTLPNLMAVLSGYTTAQADKNICNTRSVSCLDLIPFIWNKYKNAGYRTAFAEDVVSISTFNNFRPGFVVPPVEFYLRPFLLAIHDELKRKVVYGKQECIGHRLSMDYVLDYCKHFINHYLKKESIFGLCWTNAFSSSRYYGQSKYEKILLNYMQEFNRSGLFNESIVIFFSDHGARYGMLRHLPDGYLEARRPILYIWLPPWFRQKYPQFAKALVLNRHRLTSNYDLYMTLEHILLLGFDDAKSPVAPKYCKSCQSLFYPAAANRDCSDAGISEHWCTCHEYTPVFVSDPKVCRIMSLVIESMNNNTVKKNFDSVCSSLTLHRVIEASRRTKAPQRNDNVEFSASYRIKFMITQGNAEFEATVGYNSKTNTISLDPDTISRLTLYSDMATCIKHKEMKKYCICKSYLKRHH